MQIYIKNSALYVFIKRSKTYSAAPTTDKATARPIPRVAHIYGDVFSKNLIKLSCKNVLIDVCIYIKDNKKHI